MRTDYLTNDRQPEDSVPASLDSEEATSLIVQKARNLVNRLIEHRGHDKPPFLPEGFARLQNVKRIEKAELGEASALLLTFHDGLLIKVNKNHNPARQNFSCAHEIGHTLLSELKLGGLIRNIEYRRLDPRGSERLHKRATERLCDIAATELLMPESVFGKYLSSFGVSIHSIERLANIFGVSIQATAIRTAEVSIEPCIALLWHLNKRTKSKALRLAWHVGPGRKSRVKANYTPMQTLARHTSTLYKAYQDDSPVKSSKFFKLDTVMKHCPMESKGFGRGETRRVISLAFPDR